MGNPTSRNLVQNTPVVRQLEEQLPSISREEGRAAGKAWCVPAARPLHCPFTSRAVIEEGTGEQVLLREFSTFLQACVVVCLEPLLPALSPPSSPSYTVGIHSQRVHGSRDESRRLEADTTAS